MTVSAYQIQLIAERNARIYSAIGKKQSDTHICSVEGVDPAKVANIRKDHRKKHGDIQGKSPKEPYGLTPDTTHIRSRLADRIHDLRRRQLERWEVSRMIGLTPMAGLNAATESRHDWKMSELERLARAGDTTFLDLILMAERPVIAGFGEKVQAEKDKWNSMIQRYLIG